MSDDVDAIKFLGSLQRLDLQPGDKFVLKCNGELTPERIERIRETWKRFIGDDFEAFALLVLEDGMDIGSIRGLK